ncbi:hypothetical protein [Marinicella rhabdoformis]|uniref:hypothetical protein n=1 Tax=Marinicella rhabdoformis TaxID=2580566 RepID=UPI0012AEBEEB|nr:hypothetical protein [Marinicella rhabdoformis]
MNSELNQCVVDLLNFSRPASQLRPEVMALKNILLNVSDFNACPDEGIAAGETLTPHGLAISPSNAARCTDDYVRTIQFIRGAHAAVEDLLDQGHESVHLLYVGCGPLAVLLIPLLVKFKGQGVRFTVIDIHEESIQSVNAILDALSLDDQPVNLICGDAMNCLTDMSDAPDVVLVEVMQTALQKEPQVAVCRHIMQNHPQAKLVPESITLSLIWVDPAIEFSQNHVNKDSFRRDLGAVFKFDQTLIDGLESMDCDVIPAAVVAVPDDLDLSGLLQIFTSIQVYKDKEITAYQSGLTSPLHFDVDLTACLGKRIHFEYQVLENPGVIVKEISD